MSYRLQLLKLINNHQLHTINHHDLVKKSQYPMDQNSWDVISTRENLPEDYIRKHIDTLNFDLLNIDHIGKDLEIELMLRGLIN